MKILVVLALCLYASTAGAAEIVKNGQLGIAPGQVAEGLKAGDERRLELVVNEKLGDKNTQWRLDTIVQGRWVPYGGVSVDRQSLQTLDIADLTKIEMQGLFLSSGEIKVEKLRLVDQERKFAIEVNGAVATKVASGLTEADRKNPAWILSPIAIGGWDYFKLSLLGLVLVGALIAVIWALVKILRKRKKRASLNPKEAALAKLEELQGFARGGNKKTQPEWKHFSYGLAHILRRFSEELYHFPTHDLTDRELLDALVLLVDQRSSLDELRAVLQALDSARYGQQEGDSSAAAALLVDAKRFIERLYEREEAKRKAAEGAKK